MPGVSKTHQISLLARYTKRSGRDSNQGVREVSLVSGPATGRTGQTGCRLEGHTPLILNHFWEEEETICLSMPH